MKDNKEAIREACEAYAAIVQLDIVVTILNSSDFRGDPKIDKLVEKWTKEMKAEAQRQLVVHDKARLKLGIPVPGT